LNPSRVTAKVDPVDPGDPGRGLKKALLRSAFADTCLGEMGSLLRFRDGTQLLDETGTGCGRTDAARTASETQPRRSLSGPWWVQENLSGAAATVSERPTLCPTEFGVAKPDLLAPD
jgi:hypothetical protein